MKKNVGSVDALLRITFGLTGVACGIARMVERPYRTGSFILTLLSAMKVGEGITRFCPSLYLLGLNTRDGVRNKKKFPYRTRHYPRTEYNKK